MKKKYPKKKLTNIIIFTCRKFLLKTKLKLKYKFYFYKLLKLKYKFYFQSSFEVFFSKK